MTCYVDSVRQYPDAGLRYPAWCHLLADDREELHALATGLGIPRRAFQDHAWRWHYDLPAELRPAALAAGAQPVEFHAVGQLLRARRAALGRGDVGNVAGTDVGGDVSTDIGGDVGAAADAPGPTTGGPA